MESGEALAGARRFANGEGRGGTTWAEPTSNSMTDSWQKWCAATASQARRRRLTSHCVSLSARRCRV